MKISRSLVVFLLFMLSIIGICGVNQREIESDSPNGTAPALPSQKDEKTCPSNSECKDLPAYCLRCDISDRCIYGRTYNVTCSVADHVQCNGDRMLEKSASCRFCYQTDHWEHTCFQKANCNSVASPKAYYRTTCSVKDNVICLGRRQFFKNLPCNWTGGYRWSTALALSITLGGFGADRFYLGHWQEGIGKLFSFGGLGVWTLIDVILIALHYLGPADGSLYL